MGVNQGKQFNYEKRSTLENLLNQGKGAKEIAGIFLMDPTSIAREIKRNREALASMFRWIFLGKPHQSRQELLVLGIPDLSFILLYGCQDTIQATVISLFGDLERRLGIEGFKTLFPAILTDRDVKFDDFLSLEIDGNGEKRTHIFFCDPGASNQKAVVENLNSQLRAMFPKKAILDAYTQEELDEASSHFNSRFLSSIDDRTPIDLFASIFGKEMLERLHIKSIDPKEVKLKPIHR